MSAKKNLCCICSYAEKCKMHLQNPNVNVTDCKRFEPNEEYKQMCIRQAFAKLAKIKGLGQ